MAGIERYALALSLTLLIESPVYALLLVFVSGVSARAATLSGVRVNLVSHPAAFGFAFPLLLPALGYGTTLGLVEGFVVVLEATLLWESLRRDAMVLGASSVVANGLSFAVGLLIIR
jgi:hypothetical protein